MSHAVGDRMQGLEVTRERVVAGAIQSIRAHGLRAVDYFTVARAANVEVWVVKELFPEWNAVIAAAVGNWHGAARRQSRVIAEDKGTVEYLRHLLRLNQLDPSMMRTRISLMSAACDPTYPAGGWYRDQYAEFVQDVTLFLTRDMIEGREPRSMAPRHAAKQLIAVYDGLQLQYLLTAEPDVIGTWDRAIARMRSGWSSEYAAQD